MDEEILNLLVKVPGLKVIGRTSSFQFKGKTNDLRSIGVALGAAYIVEGSVRRVGDEVRVTAELIDARDGAHRWSDTYDRKASDVLKVQDAIAAGLVRALQLEVTAASHRPAHLTLRSGDAYDSYLRGLHALDSRDQLGLEQAIAHFRRALTLDPEFVPAAVGLARALRDLVDDWLVAARTGWEEARAATAAALALDPNSARAHAILGNIYTEYDWDWPAARRELQTALALAQMQEVAVPGVQAAGFAVVYQALHRSKEADAALAQLEAQHAQDLALLIAEAYAFRGKKETAFRLLERAYLQKAISFPLFMGDPLLQNLHGNSRYAAFLRKMNLPQ